MTAVSLPHRPLPRSRIGASAGGVDVLMKLVSSLPEDLPHALCIVLHLPPTGRSMLGPILSRPPSDAVSRWGIVTESALAIRRPLPRNSRPAQAKVR